MEYKAAGKAWLDSVVKDGKEAYIKLFNKLLELGSPYIDNFNQVDREQVFKCIRDKTGRLLDDDNFVTYVETEEEKEKPRYVLTSDTKVALTDYYNAVHTLCEAQQNFAKSTQVLEKKIEDKSIFLDIIRQVQLSSVQVQVRTVEEMEKMEGKTYRELTLMCHLPNFKRMNPNAKEQTRTMAAYIFCILYKQITGIRASQTGCATDFRCCTVPFSLFADPERILRRLYVFAEEPCKSTTMTSEPCSPVFKEAQPRPSARVRTHKNLDYHINNLNLYLYVFGLSIICYCNKSYPTGL